MSEFIPNSFQTPNAYVDEFMALLTSDEYKVLSYTVRRIFGFQKRQDRISLTQFVDGITKRDGKRLCHGTGLSRPTVVKCLASLEKFRLISRVNPGERSKIGTNYELQLESEMVNWEALNARLEDWENKNKSRMENVRFSPDSLVNDIDQSDQSISFTNTSKSYLPPLVNMIYTQNTVLNPEEIQNTRAPEIPEPMDSASRSAAVKRGDLLDGMIHFSGMQQGQVDVSQYPEDVREIIRAVCEAYNLTPPRKIKGSSFNKWIQDARLLMDAGGSLTVQAIRDLKDHPYDWMLTAMISQPSALTNAVRKRAGELRQTSSQQETPEQLAARRALADKLLAPEIEKYKRLNRSLPNGL